MLLTSVVMREHFVFILHPLHMHETKKESGVVLYLMLLCKLLIVILLSCVCVLQRTVRTVKGNLMLYPSAVGLCFNSDFTIQYRF